MKPIVIPLSMSSVFLLPCQDGYLQVDAGYEHDYPIYRKNLSKAGVALESVRYLIRHCLSLQGRRRAHRKCH
jgi:hypothetical protein